jgi:hypothetical protein
MISEWACAAGSPSSSPSTHSLNGRDDKSCNVHHA